MTVPSVILAGALLLSSSSAAVAADLDRPVGGGHVSGYVLVSLNPQPEPPGIVARAVSHVSLRTRVAEAAAHATAKHDGSSVELNPQPEPPGITDARRLPPGPCRGIVVTVAVRDAAAASAHASPTPVNGKCSYDVAMPGVRAGTPANVTFTRER